LRKCLRDHTGAVRVCAAPGQHVLEGEPLIRLQQSFDRADRLTDAISIGDFRSDGQGAVFQVRLLVEVAARALSPAVNDFYTALAACDRMTTAMLGQADIWIDDGKVPVYADETRIELPGQDFRGLFDDPLDALRQAACEYPSVSIRMIDNYARLLAALPARCDSADLRAFVTQKARELADHAADRATAEVDRAAIRERIARFDAAA
jgi:uncharacterized membrane protein